MTHNETRISNERLAEIKAKGIGTPYSTVRIPQREVLALVAEIQALRSTPVEAEPAVWRWTYSIEEGGRMMGPFYGERAPDLSDWPNAVVTPLYAHPLPNPSPSDGEVSDADLIRVANAIAQAFHTEHGEWLSQYTRIEMAKASLQSKRGQP